MLAKLPPQATGLRKLRRRKRSDSSLAPRVPSKKAPRIASTRARGAESVVDGVEADVRAIRRSRAATEVTPCISGLTSRDPDSVFTNRFFELRDSRIGSELRERYYYVDCG